MTSPPEPDHHAVPDPRRANFHQLRDTTAGFVVPLVFDQTEVNEFLLVPFVGACIHVPPPPPNQMILVRSHEPVEIGGLYDPVCVTGEFQAPDLTIGLTAGQSAGGELVPVDVVSVGYEITAQSVEEYEWGRSVGAVSSVCRSCVNSLHSRSTAAPHRTSQVLGVVVKAGVKEA